MASDSDLLAPCRAYRPGDHARWLRGRLIRSMVIASIVGAIVSVPLSLLLGYATLEWGDPAATAAGWSTVVLFPVAFTVLHWAIIGRRRWTAIELVVWAGRISAARYQATTGIRDPSDRSRAAAWLASSPWTDGEPVETAFWRAYVLLLLDDPDAARAELARLSGATECELERATLTAQLALAEGSPADAGTLEAIVAGMERSEERSAAAVEVGALRSQVAWTCGEDDVAPVLAALPLVEGRADGTLLRHYWLALAAMTLATWAAITLLFSLLG
jgi:hypothetical protein